jgi:hypothetical protein
MWRKYKLSLQTDDFIEKTITITVITVVITAIPCITATDKNHIALYIIRKDITHKNILRRSKKSLKLSLKINLRTVFRSK